MLCLICLFKRNSAWNCFFLLLLFNSSKLFKRSLYFLLFIYLFSFRQNDSFFFKTHALSNWSLIFSSVWLKKNFNFDNVGLIKRHCSPNRWFDHFFYRSINQWIQRINIQVVFFRREDQKWNYSCSKSAIILETVLKGKNKQINGNEYIMASIAYIKVQCITCANQSKIAKNSIIIKI